MFQLDPSSPEARQLAVEVLQLAAQIRDDPKRFAGYRGRELEFVRDAFDIEPWSPDNPEKSGLTPDQVELFLAAFEHPRVTCKAGHSTGKSFVLSLIVLTWLYVWQGIVITTASTWDQVRLVLWREIGMRYRQAKLNLPALDGHPLLTEISVTKDWLAYGRSTDDAGAFVGVHHEHLLVVVDEACAVADDIHQAASALCTAEHNHIVEVGNPVSVDGLFYKHHTQGTMWKRLTMSCFDHPNVIYDKQLIPGAVSRRWIQEQLELWGSEDAPMYQAKVLGEFPTTNISAVFPVKWIDRAMAKEKGTHTFNEVTGIMAVDVSRYGDNKTVCALRRKGEVLPLDSWVHKDTMETSGRVIQLFDKYKPLAIVVDVVGVGGGVVDRLVEQGYPVIPFESGRPAADRNRFINRRAEQHWRLREAMERDEITLPLNDFLRDDMIRLQYKVESSGKTKIESKEDMRRRGVPSPDHSDAVVMTMVMDDEVDDLVVTAPIPDDRDPAYESFDRPVDDPARWDAGALASLGVGY